MKLSIIICTRNRAASLSETLASIADAHLPAEAEVELLVVDNGSADRTGEVVLGARLEGVEVRHVFVGEPGKAVALNVATREATGDVLLYTDDDVRPVPEWIVRHIAAYEDTRIAAVQGAVHLCFDAPPPAWLQRVHRVALAEVRRGDAFLFPDREHLVGANMSIRKDVLVALGGYSELLGPGRAGFWEESELSERLKRAGYQQAYEPRALVEHQINASRLTPDYFRDVAFRNGVSSYIASELGAFPPAKRVFRHFLWSTLRHVKWRLIRRAKGEQVICPPEEFFYRMEMGSTWARLLGMERLKRRFGTLGGAARGAVVA